MQIVKWLTSQDGSADDMTGHFQSLTAVTECLTIFLQVDTKSLVDMDSVFEKILPELLACIDSSFARPDADCEQSLKLAAAALKCSVSSVPFCCKMDI